MQANFQKSQQPDEQPLGSWKEVADFFGVTVRTAQIWERERALPVRRNPGGRGRVYAYPSELRAWREGALTVADSRQEPPQAAPPRRRISHWILWVAPLLVAVISLATFWLPQLRRGTPATWRLAGQFLVVANQEGRTLWTHRFDSAPADLAKNDLRTKPLLTDLDGDSATELLFPEVYNSHEFASRLVCFNASGSIRWTYQQDRTVTTAREKFAPPYHISHFAVLAGVNGKPARVVVSANHRTFYPAVLALLDGTNGAVLREYWHSGHVNTMLVTDLVPGGGPEIYLGAISNSYRQTSIIALDPENFGGASHEENSGYQILGMPPPRELCRILIPRTIAGQMLSPFGVVTGIRREGDRLITGVDETPLRAEHPVLQIIFGPRLGLIDVSFASVTYPDYRMLHSQGLIPSGDPDPELPSLRKMRYLTQWPRESGQSAIPSPPTAR